MRRNGVLSVGRRALAAAAVVVLAAGVAWAMETLTVAVPAGTEFTATAVVVPGTAGAEVYAGPNPRGGMEDNGVELRVGFGTDLLLNVNGQVGPSYSPACQYTVTMDCVEVDEVWYADTTVYNDTLGLLEFEQLGHVVGDKPADITAEAEDVVSLDVE